MTEQPEPETPAPPWARRVLLVWEWFRRMEPARLRAAWAALVAQLAVLGISVSAEVDGRVLAVISILGIVLPLLQGEATRRQVVPVARHNAQLLQAKYQPPPM